MSEQAKNQYTPMFALTIKGEAFAVILSKVEDGVTLYGFRSIGRFGVTYIETDEAGKEVEVVKYSNRHRRALKSLKEAIGLAIELAKKSGGLDFKASDLGKGPVPERVNPFAAREPSPERLEALAMADAFLAPASAKGNGGQQQMAAGRKKKGAIAQQSHASVRKK